MATSHTGTDEAKMGARLRTTTTLREYYKSLGCHDKQCRLGCYVFLDQVVSRMLRGPVWPVLRNGADPRADFPGLPR